MILLLGGTSETSSLAEELAGAGYDVLVSTATDVPLAIGAHPRIQRRSGRLDEEGMADLIRDASIRGIVDATHPYAALARRTARAVSERLTIPYFTLIRPTGLAESDKVFQARSHDEAARIACDAGKPVFLTTGANNLEPYAREAGKAGVPLVVRVLPEETSLDACRAAGIPEANVIAARGPFSVEDNILAMEKYRIGVIVIKDSGQSGGTPEKVEAAQKKGCRIVVVMRPADSASDAFEDISLLVSAVKAKISL